METGNRSQVDICIPASLSKARIICIILGVLHRILQLYTSTTVTSSGGVLDMTVS